MIRPQQVSRAGLVVIACSLMMGVGAVTLFPADDTSTLEVDSRVADDFGSKTTEGAPDGTDDRTLAAADAQGEDQSTTTHPDDQSIQSTVPQPADSTSTSDVLPSTNGEGSGLDAAPSTTQPVPTTVSSTLSVPVVNWQCVGEYLYGDAGQTSTPSYSLAMWQMYGGQGLPEEHPELWGQVAQAMVEGGEFEAPGECIS